MVGWVFNQRVVYTLKYIDKLRFGTHLIIIIIIIFNRYGQKEADDNDGQIGWRELCVSYDGYIEEKMVEMKGGDD